MSRRTTSRASFPWASAAIRRAWSIGLKLCQCSRRDGHRDRLPGSAQRRRAGRRRRCLRRRRHGGEAHARRSARGRSRRSRPDRAARAGRARRRVASLGKPGRVATASRASSSTAPGSFQRAKSQNSSAPIRKIGSSHSGCARSRSTVRGVGSSSTSSPGNAARASCRRNSAGVSTCLWPGSAETSTSSRSSRELLFRALGELDVTEVRRIERAAVEAERRGHASSNSSSPTSTVAPTLAPAARSARSSSSSGGGVPSTRKPPSVRSSRHARVFGCGR